MKFKNNFIFIFIFLLLISIIIYNSFTKNTIVEEYGRHGGFGRGRGRALGYGAGAYGLYHGYNNSYYGGDGDYGYDYPLYYPYRYHELVYNSSYENPIII
jgi:hypothetical protein